MKIAIAGNPNSGKTTLFNRLTGSTAHVGNWPGVTVDKKSGFYSIKKKKNCGTTACGGCPTADACGSVERVEIIDLPGIYSLSAYSPEEIIARDFITSDHPDCLINIVDATNLERNLYLSTQLLEMNVPVVIALNMIDEVRKSGGDVAAAELSKALNVPVVKISALKGEGIDELMQAALTVGVRKGRSVLEQSVLSTAYSAVLRLYQDAKIENPAFSAAKMLEDDEIELSRHADIAAQAVEIKKTAGLLKNNEYNGEVADARYKYIERLCKETLKKVQEAGARSERIDRVLTHKWFGIPIFLLIMATVFHLTFSENLFFIGLFIPEGTFEIPIIGADGINSLGVMMLEAVVWLAEAVKEGLGSVMPEGTWYTSLICDGLLEGLFAVLSFVPQIMMLFFFISILEDSGYMARVAFIMDRALRRLGLSGKAFMPMIMCFGCAVPGIMGMRILEDEGERRRAIYISPFFSCGAKLPIWAAFAGVFAQSKGLSGEFIVVSMYVLGIVVAIVASLLLKTFLAKSATPPLILEMPSYRMPNARNVLLHLWEKLKHYLFRAATIIAGAIVLIWFLSNFSFKIFIFNFEMVESGDSIIGMLGKGLAYVFYPLGFALGADGWKFVVAVITGLVAKEIVVATMGTFAGIDDVEGELSGTALGALMLGIGGTLGGVSMAIPAMYAFMAFNLLSIPCMAAVSAARAELKNKKHFWGAIGFWLATAYVVSGLIFWFGVLATFAWWAALLVALAIVAALTFLIVRTILKVNKTLQK